VASVIALDVNETLLDLHALDEPFKVLLGSASLRPQWFALMLQLAFTGGLTGRYVNFTTAQRAALVMLAEREGVPLTASDIEGLVGRMSSLPPHAEVPGALAALARTRLGLVA
jgi:2-haloacid dehalogenase